MLTLRFNVEEPIYHDIIFEGAKLNCDKFCVKMYRFFSLFYQRMSNKFCKNYSLNVCYCKYIQDSQFFGKHPLTYID